MENRRSSVRIPIEIWVEEASERELYFQRGADLSVGGIYLDRTIPHPLGTVVSLQFSLLGESEPFRVKGEIVNAGRKDHALGMGVKFVALSDDDRARIQRYIENVASKS